MSNKILHEVHIWGTVVSFDIRDRHLRNVDTQTIGLALDHACDWLQQVDEKFSTYRATSLTSQYRQGVAIADPMFDQVQAACQALRDQTQGAFDPWSAAGGFDPSAYVKGWAADHAARLLSRAGLTHFQINAGGDVVVRGGRDIGQAWRIGIVNPFDTQQCMTTIELTHGCVATSGHYERGKHISGATVDSATVVGPDAGVADALSTALMVAGTDGLSFIAQYEGYSGLVIDGSKMTMCGPAFV